MNTIKNYQIPGLYKINKSQYKKIYDVLLDAFKRYPKLVSAFPDEDARYAALEATIRYYVAYDLRYGTAYSLDDGVTETAVIVHSDEMKYTFLRHLLAGSFSKKYRDAMNRLSKADQAKRLSLFEEMDRLEATVDIPRPHIYLDFLGVTENMQHQGRGRKLMTSICKYADHVKLPIMLFTNTTEDVEFYKSLGFKIIGITSSEKFGFTNTYLLYDPK